MVTLKARWVRQPRERFICDWCEQRIIGPYIYMYGMADDHDKPIAVRYHAQCLLFGHSDPKIKAALEKAREAYQDLQESNLGRIG